MTIRLPLLASVLLLAAPALAQDDPARLTIDGAEPLTIRDRAALSRALQDCRRADRCNAIMVETCDRCWVAAERSGKGFALNLRTGPPGPFFVAVRIGKGGGAPFTLRETEAILALQLDGAPTEPGWYRWQEEDMFE